MKRIFASFTLILCIASTPQAQNKWFVITGALTTGTGTSWADPRDLQTAINSASAGDSVFVAQGTYQPVSSQSFNMAPGVKIYGGFAGTETYLSERNLKAGHISILHGNGVRVFFNNNNGLDQTAVLDGFTITGGSALTGGGMYNVSVSPTISNCIIRNNFGGGILMGFSSSRIVNCVFAENIGSSITYGGGIQMGSSNNASIINCVFWRNSGSNAGGISIDDVGPVSPKIINCTFNDNNYTAIYCQSRSTPTIKNCVIWGHQISISLASSVIVPVISNNIIERGHLGNLKVDPLFVDANNPAGADGIWGTADDGLRLQAGSAAFNSGTADTNGLSLPDLDMAGNTRVQGNKVDIGVYENNFSCAGFTTLYVDAGVAATGDGGSWATAFKTLDEALFSAEQCTTATEILVAAGTYQSTWTNSFRMLNNVKIYGGFPAGGGSFAQRDMVANSSILQGTTTSVLYNHGVNATALLDGFTITGGKGPVGAGMYNFQSSPSINNCIFSGNIANSSGGTGGGMYNRENSRPVISNSLFTGNTASTTGIGGGGGMFNSNASPVISNCIFENNSASYGGAIYDNDQGAAGIPFYPTSVVLTNTVFSGNTASGDGAAYGAYGTSLTLNNCTFVNNAAGGGGGAIDIYDCDASINNSIFWGNTAGTNPDIWYESGNHTVSYSFLQVTRSGTGNLLGSASPFKNITTPSGADGLWRSADDGLILLAGGPCVNAGIPDTTGLSLGDYDIAGNARIIGAAVDIGAYEFDNAALPVTLKSFSGYLQKSTAHLQWSTGMETNFNHFKIEKSTDGKSFQVQGEVTARGSVSNYTFNTLQPEETAYYRLRMVDNDGTSQYSRILRLSQSVSNDMQVYPNPAQDHVSIKVAKAGTISIYSASGTLIKTVRLLQGVNIIEVSEWRSGMYYGVMDGQRVKLIKK